MAKGGTSNPLGYFNDMYEKRRQNMSGSSMLENTASLSGDPVKRKKRAPKTKSHACWSGGMGGRRCR